MMTKAEWVDQRDRSYAQQCASEDLREAVTCVVTTYRRVDTLAVGDPVPGLALSSLDASLPLLPLRRPGDRPIVLLFGSYT